MAAAMAAAATIGPASARTSDARPIRRCTWIDPSTASSAAEPSATAAAPAAPCSGMTMALAATLSTRTTTWARANEAGWSRATSTVAAKKLRLSSTTAGPRY